jgi:hypothetical protein
MTHSDRLELRRLATWLNQISDTQSRANMILDICARDEYAQHKLRLLPVYQSTSFTINTLFIPLPAELSPQASLSDGKCFCDHCTKHSTIAPKHDTITIAYPPRANVHEFTGLVHYPELQDYKEALGEIEKGVVQPYRGNTIKPTEK